MPREEQHASVVAMETDELLLQAKEICECAKAAEEDLQREHEDHEKAPASPSRFLKVVAEVWKDESLIEVANIGHESRSIEGTDALLRAEDLSENQQTRPSGAANVGLALLKGLGVTRCDDQLCYKRNYAGKIAEVREWCPRFATAHTPADSRGEIPSKPGELARKEDVLPQCLPTLIHDVQKTINTSISGTKKWIGVASTHTGDSPDDHDARLRRNLSPTPGRIQRPALPFHHPNIREGLKDARERKTGKPSSTAVQKDGCKREGRRKFNLLLVQPRYTSTGKVETPNPPAPASELSLFLRRHIVAETGPSNFACREISFEGLSENDLRIQELNGTRAVNLDGNAINSIKDPELFARMQNLSAAHNHMIEMNNLHKFKALVRLDLGWNNLTCLPALDPLDGLEWLSLEHNQLRDVAGLRGCCSLKLLTLRGNHISNLSNLPSNSKIVFLDVSFNPIMNFTGLEQLCPHLAYLLAEHCCLHWPGLLALPDLKALDVRANRVSSLSWLHALQSLEVLDLSHNKVDDIGEVRDFISWHKQCKIDIRYNLLEENAVVAVSNQAWSSTSAAIGLKELIRQHPVFPEADRCRLVQCVIIIQSHCRRLIAYRRVKKLRKKHRRLVVTKAAVCIQSCWRGHRARIGCTAAIEVRRLEELHLHHAASRIQSVWRGIRSRRKMYETSQALALALKDLKHDVVDFATSECTLDLRRFLRPVRMPACSSISRSSAREGNFKAGCTKFEGSCHRQQERCEDLPVPCDSGWGITNPKTAALLFRSQHRKLLGERSRTARSKLQDPLERLKRFHARESRHRSSERPSPGASPSVPP